MNEQDYRAALESLRKCEELEEQKAAIEKQIADLREALAPFLLDVAGKAAIRKHKEYLKELKSAAQDGSPEKRITYDPDKPITIYFPWTQLQDDEEDSRELSPNEDFIIMFKGDGTDSCLTIDDVLFGETDPEQPPDPLVSEIETKEQEIEHTAWLQAKVAASLADPRPSIPHDEVARQMELRLAKLREQHANKAQS